MKSVCGTDPGNPSQSLIRRVCYPNCNKLSNQATTWGCEHEPLARTAYIDVMKTTHKNFVCKQSGLVVSVIHPFIGANPDGQVECDCCGQGVLEIKCPYCIRTEDPNDASFLVNGSLSKKHAYYYQVQTQLFATQAKYADFVVATFAGKVANIVMERISPDENFIEECITKSMYFFKMCILPELLAKWYTRKEVMPTETAAASTSVASNGEYLYCYCKEDKGGEMIGCDNSKCSHGLWFHLTCLKLKTTPRSKKWYCPNCRTLPQFTCKRARKT